MTEVEINARAAEYAREPAQARFMEEQAKFKGRAWVWNTWLAGFTEHCQSCKPHQVPEGIRAGNLRLRA